VIRAKAGPMSKPVQVNSAIMPSIARYILALAETSAFFKESRIVKIPRINGIVINMIVTAASGTSDDCCKERII